MSGLHSVSLGPTDVLVITVDIGNLGVDVATRYMESLKEKFTEELGAIKIIMVPMRPGSAEIQLAVIKRTA